jgi:threonine/homoserine/homoserine lactone efflux protein
VGEAIGASLPSAIGVAISPLPIVAVILMLFSARARQNAPAFAIGWALGIAVVFAIVFLLTDPANVENSGNEPSTTASVIQLLLGVLLLFFAYRQFAGRPKEGETPEMPKWMQSIDNMQPAMAFGFGALMSAINPKNLLLDIAGATAIAQIDTGWASKIGAAIVFIIIASVSVGGIVIWYFAAGKSAEVKLDQLKGWLLQNNSIVMAVLLSVFGVVQLGKGIEGLFA